MREDSKHIIGLNEYGHLDENSLAACSEWLKGEDNELDKHIKEHLEKCIQCKRDVLEISELENYESLILEDVVASKHRFEETCAAKYSPVIKPVNKSQFWRVAAVIVVLISVTSLTFLIKPKKEGVIVGKYEQGDSLSRKSDRLGKELDSTQMDSGDYEKVKLPIHIESIEDNQYADNFLPNAGYEALIGARFRAGALPSMIGPPKDTSLMQADVLSFSASNPANEILEVQILDNKGSLVKSFSKLKNVDFELKLNFDPGLYYWKLLGEEDLYQVGKILLKQRRE